LKKPRLRALVLSAGRGTRLLPLTAFIPKPLLPVRGVAALAHTIDQLAALGCEAVAVNLFHRGEMIRESLGGSYSGVPLTFSIEERLLGTLGALGPLRGFLGEAEQVIVVNGDSLCRWPLRALVRRHVRSGADATLLVSRRIDPEPFGGGVGVARHRWIVSLRGGRDDDEGVTRRVFMGAHVISPSLLERVPDGPGEFVQDLYEPLLSEGGRIVALQSSREWHDLGTPERYRRAVLDWGRGRAWLDPDAEVAMGARVRSSVVEQDAFIDEGTTVSRSVVLPGAGIGTGCRVVESIVGPGVALPPHTTVERRMVTTVRADATASKDASVVGGLVYEPI
jgi:NDP-sugar pyrophosphorylase family protein